MRFAGLVLLCACVSPPDPPVDLEAPWPDWATSHWVWEDESTQESALALVEGYQSRGIPVGAIVIDSPWATGYSTFEWDHTRFPDPAGMVDDLHSRGVRVVVWTVPGINIDVQPLYDEAAAAGFFMQRGASASPGVVDWWKGQGSLIDYFNPEAVTWWHGLVDKTLAETEIDGWKTDGLDFSSLLSPYSPGLGHEVARIDYSAAYYRDFFDYTRASLGDDRMIMSRPVDNYGGDVGGDLVAFTPVDITWAGWVGDQDATFEGLNAALLNYWWSADYGYVSIGSDIGGYRDDDDFPETGRGKELFLRWAQLGAVSPLMENGGGGRHEPWVFDDEAVEVYRDAVLLHEALRPYLDREGAAALRDGRSLLTFLGKQGDYRYLLGPDLFVAPLLEGGGTRSVTFPSEGRWVDVFAPTRVYEPGSDAVLQVPISEYPVFVKQDSRVASTLLSRGSD